MNNKGKIFTVLLLILALPNFLKAQEICSEPLKEALMTVNNSADFYGSDEAYSAWQCSFKFNTHDQAIDSGLDIGATIYGVPLKVGGKFNKKEVSTWKSENCSKNSSSASYETSTIRYLRQVAPGAMDAYVACISATTDTGALSCNLSEPPAVFTAKWRRVDGELESAAPVVESFMVTNGNCERKLKRGERVQEGGIGTPCLAREKADLLVVLETNRGICDARLVAEKDVYNITGDVVLNTDRKIEVDEIVFSNDAKIITNGNSLTLVADKLSIDSPSQILSYDRDVDNRKPGDLGISGGALVIKAKQITGNDLTIDLTGQDGVAGKPGIRGSTGASGRNAKGRGWKQLKGCVTGHPSTAGGRGGDGTAGTPGGNGGNGGVIVLNISEKYFDSSVSRLAIVSDDNSIPGGVKGLGGAGGAKGPGGRGGSSSKGSDTCGGRGGSSNGPDGQPGADGADGEDGKSGSISTFQS